MKPTKNRIYCKDGERVKMVFETEKKAHTFIKFNGEEIAAESGYAPTRAYFCIACNGWHITSKQEAFHGQTKTEIILASYQEERKKRAEATAKKEAHRKLHAEQLAAQNKLQSEQLEAQRKLDAEQLTAERKLQAEQLAAHLKSIEYNIRLFEATGALDTRPSPLEIWNTLMVAWDMAKGIAGNDQKKSHIQKKINELKLHMGDDENSKPH